MKSLTSYILCLILVACSSKQAEERNEVLVEEEVIIPPKVDTIRVSKPKVKEIQFENIYDVHRFYLPKVDSIISYYGLHDSLELWSFTDTINTTDYIETTEGSHLIVSVLDSFTRYQLFLLSETMRTEEIFYLAHDSIRLYSNTGVHYERPIYWDSARAAESGDSIWFGTTPHEYYPEDSYFERGKIVYQISADAGAPNAVEYVNEVEKEVYKSLKLINEIIGMDSLDY